MSTKNTVIIIFIIAAILMIAAFALILWYIARNKTDNYIPKNEKNSIESKASFSKYWLNRPKCKIVMFFTKNLIDEWLNFLASARKVGVDDLIIAFPLDNESAKAIKSENIAVNSDFIDESFNGGDFGTKEFKKICNIKFNIILSVLKKGYYTFYLDTDIVLFKDPVSDYFSVESKPVYIQSDLTTFENDTSKINNHCAGIIFLRPGRKSETIMKKAIEKIHTTDKVDQEALNDLINSNKDIKNMIGTLDPIAYPNGARYFTDKGRVNSKIKDPVLVHNNYIVGIDAKIKRFKKYGLWYI